MSETLANPTLSSVTELNKLSMILTLRDSEQDLPGIQQNDGHSPTEVLQLGENSFSLGRHDDTGH